MNKVAKGFFWNVIERFAMQGTSFLLSILIARLVLPSSYGVIVLIQVFLSFSQIFIDSGFSNALIQKKDRTETDYNTVFYFNLFVAVFLYLILFALAPWISEYYREPQLVLVIRVISLNLILISLSIVQKTKLTIELSFKSQALASLLGVLFGGGIGLICAYSRLEVWALVVQTLLNTLTMTIVLMLITKWKPKLTFSIKSFKVLFSFGSKLLIAKLLTNVYLNMYNIVIGKKYSSADLAYYNRAFVLAQYPSGNIISILGRITYPMQCSLQNDRNKLLDCYYKYLRLSCYIIFPVMSLVAILAYPLIEVILTIKWLPVAPLLSILCLCFLFSPIIDNNVQILNVLGKSGLNLYSEIVRRFVSIIIFFICFSQGIEVLCWGLAINANIELLIALFFTRRGIGISPLQQFGAIKDIIVINVLMATTVFLLSLLIKTTILALLIGIIVGFFEYAIFTFLFDLREKNLYIKIWNRLYKKE